MKLTQKHFFYLKTPIKKSLTSHDRRLNWHWFSWGQVAKWPRFFILCVKLTINHVPHALFFRDLSWPDLESGPYLVWHLCLQYILSRPLRSFWSRFVQKLFILPALGFIMQKHQNFTFWPDLDPKVELTLETWSALWGQLDEFFRMPHRLACYDQRLS